MNIEILQKFITAVEKLPETYASYLKKQNLPEIKKLLEDVYKQLEMQLSYTSHSKNSDLDFNPKDALHYEITRGSLLLLATRFRDHIEIGNDLGEAAKKKFGTDYSTKLEEIISYAEQAKLLRNSLQEIDNDFKSLKSKTGFAVKYRDFLQEANINKKNSKIWVGLMIVSIALFIVMLIYGMKDTLSIFDTTKQILETSQKNSNITAPQGIINTTIYITIFKQLALRILLYSALIYLIVFSVKNYNARMHNYTINSQKSNSLNAAIKLFENAQTPEVKDNILQHASDAIFSHQPTAYNGKENEPTSPNLFTTVIEKAVKITERNK